MPSEKNVSTQSTQEKKRTRLPKEDEHESRQKGLEAQKGQGEDPAYRIAGSSMSDKQIPQLRWFNRPGELLSVRKAGKQYRGRYVFCWSHWSESGDTAVAVVTGRGFKGAVARNSAKRRLKGAVLDNRETIPPNRLYLFEARPGTERADYQELVVEVESALLRVGN